MTETSIRLPTKRELIQEKYKASEQASKLNDHAHLLAREGKIEASVVALRRAVALAPEHPIILSGLGAVLFDAGLYEEAEMVLRKSIGIEPEYAAAHGNLGSVLGAMQRYDEAKAACELGMEIDPDDQNARWNYSIDLLNSGEWIKAWPYYEARKTKQGAEIFYPAMPYPEWNGEDDLNGKTLYIHGEQGVGDRILCSRYLAWIKERYPQCRMLFMHGAADLPNTDNFFWAYRDIVTLLPNGIAWPDGVDYGIHLMSLPRIHGSTPDHIPADPGLFLKHSLRHKNSVEIKATDERMLKVGICWTGNMAMKRNGERSIPFELILQLAEIPNVVLYSLQIGSTDIEKFGAGQLVCDLSHQIKPFGFSGTSACILNLDLIITCCTATAHVAGALNAPCWTLLCANPYWLWLRERTDSIWYPNTVLFRQKKMNDWKPIIADVKNSLIECAEIHARSVEQKAA